MWSARCGAARIQAPPNSFACRSPCALPSARMLSISRAIAIGPQRSDCSWSSYPCGST